MIFIRETVKLCILKVIYCTYSIDTVCYTVHSLLNHFWSWKNLKWKWKMGKFFVGFIKSFILRFLMVSCKSMWWCYTGECLIHINLLCTVSQEITFADYWFDDLFDFWGGGGRNQGQVFWTSKFQFNFNTKFKKKPWNSHL